MPRGVTDGWVDALTSVGLPASDGARYAPHDDTPASHLTPDDREMIAAVTGMVVSSAGLVLDPAGRAADPLIAVLAEDRLHGRLVGPVDAAHLRRLIVRQPGPRASGVDPAHLSAALAHVTRRERRRVEDPSSRSSFSIAV